MQYCTGILGHQWGARPFPAAPGQGSLIIGSALAGDIQSFLCFALIPHLTKHAAVRVPDMLCLSGHLDIHLVSVSVNITARWTRINNSVLRVTVRSRQRWLQGHFWGFCGSLLSNAWNKTPIWETRRAENQIMRSSAHMVQDSTSSSLFCWQTKYST